jgi:FlaA1/EpsC-like NDP-sugar epimerase
MNIKIEYVGLRPGEKLYEELITDDENALPTPHPKILVLKGGACDLNVLNGQIGELVDQAREHNSEGIKSKLSEILPDYNSVDHRIHAAAI